METKLIGQNRLKTAKVDWRKLRWLQGDDLKHYKDKEKLKASLLKHGVIRRWKVWEDPETEVIYVLDGCGLQECLIELVEDELVEVPQMMEADFIECKDRQAAAELVLVYSAAYRQTSPESLAVFLEEENLDLDMLVNTVELPEFEVENLDGLLSGYNNNNGDSQSNSNNSESLPPPREKSSLILSYSEEECSEVKEALKEYGKTPEAAVWNLLFGEDG